jgi:hypothetical protein
MEIYTHAPIDIVNYILSFDKRFKICKGVSRSIIPKDDFRYTLLKSVCRFIWRTCIFDDGNFAYIFSLSERREMTSSVHKFDTITLCTRESKNIIDVSFEHNKKIKASVLYRDANVGFMFKSKCIKSSYQINNHKLFKPRRSERIRLKNMKQKS